MFGRFPGLFVGAAMLAAAGSTATSAGEIGHFSEAGWDGFAFSYDGGGGFSHCTVTSHYNSGASLFFTLNENFDFGVGLAHSDWLFRKGDKFPATLWVDSDSPFKGNALAIRNDMISFNMPATEPVYQLFRVGRMLHVRFDDRSFDFRLDGTARALAKLITCVQTYGGPAQGTAPQTRDAENTQPAADPAPANAKAAERTAQRLQATEIATNIAADAGLDGFRIINDPEERKKAGNPDALWVAGDIVGSANIVDDLQDMSIDEIAAARSVQMTGCEKEKSTATKRETVDGVATVTTVIRCVDAANKPLLIDSTLIETRPHVFFEFAFFLVNPDSGGNAVGEGSVGAQVKDAVLTVLKPQ